MSSYEKISDFMDDFLIAKEVEEGCAPSTIKAYKYDLDKFISVVGDVEVNSPMMRQKIRLFLKKLKELDYTKKAVGRKIATLRSFFKFLDLNEFLTVKNPMSIIKSPKIKLEEQLPKFLDPADIEKIFRELRDRQKFNTKKSRRYYIIVRILYSTMARVSELCNIRIRDIDFIGGSIRLRGKGNKERIVPIDPHTLHMIEDYLRDRIYYETDDYLLVNTRNQPLNPRVIQGDIKIIKEKCGFPDSNFQAHGSNSSSSFRDGYQRTSRYFGAQ